MHAQLRACNACGSVHNCINRMGYEMPSHNTGVLQDPLHEYQKKTTHTGSDITPDTTLQRCPEQHMCYMARSAMLVHMSVLQRHASDGDMGCTTMLDSNNPHFSAIQPSAPTAPPHFFLLLQSWLRKSDKAPEPSNPGASVSVYGAFVSGEKEWRMDLYMSR